MRYVAREMRALFWRFVHHGKERRRVKAPFQPSYSQCVDIYLSALHRPIAEINLILIVHPMPTAGKLKVEGQVHASTFN